LVANRDVAIKQYDAVKEHLRRSLRQEAVFPWHVLAGMDAPKFLSDIVESVIGAIYVDSQGDVGACEVFLEKLGILGCLERILRDGVDCLHPKERLGILAVEKNVQYVRVSSTENPEGIVGAGKNYSCRVRVGGKDVGGVVHGVKKLNAETMAAWEACRILGAAKRGAPDVSMGGVDHQSDEGDEWFDAEEGGVTLVG
jgi:dsRNA-specific ribonuclease